MDVQVGTTGKRRVIVHYVDAPVPYTIEENFGAYFNDHDDDALAEALQDQEIVYQSIQGSAQYGSTRASLDPTSYHDRGQSSGQRHASRNADFESPLAVDEALARALQEMENQLADTSLGDDNRKIAGTRPTTFSTSSNGSTSTNRSPQVTREDDIDPDSMTYEELQQLGEAIGTESRGLSEDVITLLPSSTYRTGIFSKNEKQDECVICYMTFKNRDKLITLPCEHQYHKDCLTTWLKINKTCPVCNKEVFGS